MSHNLFLPPFFSCFVFILKFEKGKGEEGDGKGCRISFLLALNAETSLSG